MCDVHAQAYRSVSLCEALDRVLHTGVAALAEVTISVADIDLIYLGLQLVVTSIETTGRTRLTEDNDPPMPSPCEGGASLPVIERGSSSAATLPDAGHGISPPPSDWPGRTQSVSQVGGKAPEKSGLGQLVLTLIKVLHELLKRQALRRMEAGALSIAETERLGATLMRQAQEIARLANELGLDAEELNLDLGPLGKLL